MIFKSNRYESHKTAVILPLHMLAAFALELYLKSWLLGVGKTSGEVKKYGHDIQRLYDDATRYGLPNIDQLQDLVGHLAGPHEGFTYRYIDSKDRIENTNWPVAFNVLYQLDCEVDKSIGASASHGLEPGH
jgi:hypothetical protein